MSGTPTLTRAGWRVWPRDPLVFGDGSRAPALVSRDPSVLPPQGATAGFARACFWPERGGDATTAAQGLWLPSPADARVGKDAGGVQALTRPARPAALGVGEGTYLGKNAPAALLPAALDPGAITGKPREPANRLWTLDEHVAWSLGEAIPEAQILAREDRANHLVHLEARVHVGLDDDTGTATPEALFTTSGMRLASHACVALDITGPGTPASGWRAGLGGRSRPASIDHTDPLWPDFTTVRDRYADALSAMRGPVLLRVHLTTPGSFGGCVPPLVGPLARFTLVAACVPEVDTTSGWDLVNRRPRAVRRLVPAGSVYWLRPPAGAKLIDVCGELWGAPLAGAMPNDATLAYPECDGYGQVIPGFMMEIQ